MLGGFDHGIVGASVLAKCNDMALRVVDVGLADGPTEYDQSKNVVHASDNKVKGGTKNVCRGSAMSEEEVEQCLQPGTKEMNKLINGQARKTRRAVRTAVSLFFEIIGI